MSLLAPQARAYPGFCSMKINDKEYFYFPLDGMLVHHRVPLSIKFTSTCLYTCVESAWRTLSQKVLVQTVYVYICWRNPSLSIGSFFGHLTQVLIKKSHKTTRPCNRKLPQVHMNKEKNMENLNTIYLPLQEMLNITLLSSGKCLCFTPRCTRSATININ